MNQSIKIQHQVSDTSIEIYQFQNIGDNTWKYVGISFSNRSNNNDVWGHNWDKSRKIQSKKEKELLDLAFKFGYENVAEAWDCEPDGQSFDEEAALIQRKYNPCVQKTKDGRAYYSGNYWGYGDRKGTYEPRLSQQQIKIEILNQISRILIVI